MILAVGGSILDKETFPGECLEYLILKIREECPGIKIVTLETRAEYVDFNEMNRLKGMLNEWLSVDLEIAIGFEAFDETIRNDRLNKGLTNKAFEVFCGKLSEHNIGLKTFLMLKPLPDMTDDEAIRDNILSIDYLDKISKKYHIKINAHINPAYVARGTILERKYNEGTYSPPSLVDVCRVVLSAEDKDVSIFVGLNDEGLTHDDHRISKLSCREMMVRLEKFNQTQDFDLLREAIE